MYHIPILILSACVCNQAPLCVEGWDEALHEIGKHSCETVLSPEKAAALLKAVESLPVLVIGGAEDALVALKSVQAMASKLVNSVSCLNLNISIPAAVVCCISLFNSVSCGLVSIIEAELLDLDQWN